MAAVLMAVLPMKAQQVMEDNFQRLKVHYKIPELRVSVDTSHVYSILSIDGYTSGGKVGTPSLPQLNSMITIPFCKEIEVVVENAVYDTVALPVNTTVMPMQPSRSKSDTSRHSIVVDETVYRTPGYYGDVAGVEYVGIARDRSLATLTFSPVQVDLQGNKAVICRSADITVRYIAPDEQATVSYFQRYNTPAFSVGPTLNTLNLSKYVSNATPVRMVVLAHSSLHCQKLEQFFDWKRSQGYRVDVFYIDQLTMTAPSTIAAMVKNLYTNATSEDPAPAYLLIVGDVAQVPSHNSRLGSSGYISSNHITDLYYVSWTDGDKVADCYQGRFSATDTNTLGGIVDKTMLYEQYAFEDDSYLARAVLVAGVDGGRYGDYGYTHADPAMDYIAKTYINTSAGYDTVVFYKNDTSIHPDAVVLTGCSQDRNCESDLRAFYNTGAGWINYSAHGDWDGWSDPVFSIYQVAQMTNVNMPSFMIGSCCLTNKFEKNSCFGETLLRRGDNAGAIGYVGGSNYTYWNEDFYWAVGVRNNINGSMNASYDARRPGVYDRIFHTHDESLAMSIATAGQVVYYGNMSVQGSNSDLKDYYWEIYHLMGDPTLMPWLGRAREPYAEIAVVAGVVTVNTDPGAYVAITNPADSNRTVAAVFVDTTGVATIEGSYDPNYRISVTAQNRKPYSQPLGSMGVPAPSMSAVQLSLYPNPAVGACVVTCDGMRSLQVINAVGQQVKSLVGTGSQAVVDLDGLAPGVYFLRASTQNGVATSRLVVQ